MSARNRSSGFTLIEVLAAFAITSVIIMSIAALMWNVTRFFDHGTRGVSEADRLVMAVDRLAADFAAARFAQRLGAAGAVSAAFIGVSGKGRQAAKVVFVSGAVASTSPRNEEVVVLGVEDTDDGSRLVRRRAPWRGPRTQLDGLAGEDPVTLIEGRIDIEFAFGKLTPEGTMSWQDTWVDEFTLPRYVRLTVRSRDTGTNLLSDAEFVVRSNAPPSCVADDASPTCLVAAAAATAANQPQGTAANQPAAGAANQPPESSPQGSSLQGSSPQGFLANQPQGAANANQ